MADLQVDIAKLKKDIEQVNSIHTRLDTAIDKLTDVSTSIKSMLAVPVSYTHLTLPTILLV